MAFTKAQWSWLLYDPANAAYALIVRTVFAPVFFLSAATAVWGEVKSTEYWGYTASLAGICAGIFSLATGNYADLHHKKRLFLGICSAVSIITTIILPFTGHMPPVVILVLFFFSMAGYMSANSFYDALLTDIAAPEERDRLSSTGYAWGYIGGMIPFIPVMAIAFLLPEWTFFAAFWMTALWWGCGTVPVLKNTFEHNTCHRRIDLAVSLKFIMRTPLLRTFLIAYFLYIDGIGTILLIATPIAATLQISSGFLMVIILALQLIAFPFTILYGKLSSRFGTRRMILCAIGVYVLIAVLTGILSFTADIKLKQILFVFIAFLVGTSQGGIQALSRSLFSRIIPPERTAELFGIYNFFGKFTTILGPVMIGIAVHFLGRPELGVTLLAIPFICGGIMLKKLPLPPEVK